ncbi:hypothetical protein BDY24DRAFT_399119 [Mrakia frigida]|uniref:uncharacterized protein n=1 Tax=Mrakia frigida TaxID=29902 RepID=UPI003FCC0D3C
MEARLSARGVSRRRWARISERTSWLRERRVREAISWCRSEVLDKERRKERIEDGSQEREG